MSTEYLNFEDYTPIRSYISNYYVIPLYALSFLVGIPLNGYIIYRIYARDIKKTNYYRLLMLMSALDIYIAFFNSIEFYQSGDYMHISSEIQSIILTVLNGGQTYLTLVVIIYWKSVVKARPKQDKVLYILASGHIVSLVFMLFLSASMYYYLDLYRNMLMFVLIISLASSIAFILSSYICIYCLIVVWRANTQAFSAQTLGAYKRMALAHFTQCILVELDFIAQTFSIALSSIVAYALLVVASDSKGSIEDEHLPTSTVYVFWAMEVSITTYCLIPVVKPFVRSTFIAWALRRLLTTERVAIIRIKAISSLRSTTRDN